MATHDAFRVSILTDQLGSPARPVGTVLQNITNPARPDRIGPLHLGIALGGQVVAQGVVYSPGGAEFDAVEALSLGVDWFEKLHIFPKRYDFGNIVTTTDVDVTVYNSDRYLGHSITAIINPVASGLFFVAPPPFPIVLGSQDGIALVLRATTQGVPAFDDILTFETDLYDIEFPVTGTRVILFPFRPEAPLIERMGFLTDVLQKTGGGEQRISLRIAPRQEFDLRFIREEEIERRRLTNRLIQWQGRTFGVPVWFEPTQLTVAAVAGDLTINVGSTLYADYRVDGLVGIIQDETTFDVIQIDSFTATTITLKSELLAGYPVGTEVYPVRACIIDGDARGLQYPVNADEVSIKFLSVDNVADLADAAAFSTFNSKVLLNDPNLMGGGHSLRFVFDHEQLDNKTGVLAIAQVWPYGREGRLKGFLANSRQSLWELRQLLHALRGRQVSFYLPTFRKDFTLTANLVSANASMSIEHIGFTQFVQERAPYHRIRLHKTDGTTIDRSIIGSSEVSGVEEQLTVNSNWPTNIAIAEVARIEIIELVRFDTDNFSIEHSNAIGDARVIAPVMNVLDEA